MDVTLNIVPVFLVIFLGAPAATISVIMSGEMNGDVTFASSEVTLSTLLSALTFCFWTYLIGTIGS